MNDDPDRFGPVRSAPTTPAAARVYDYMLRLGMGDEGRAYHYPVDVIAAHEFLKILPVAVDLARNNRAWVQRVVRHLADRGVDQFLDLGSGLPTVGNVHEIVAEILPGARVVYVDYERTACDLSREILEGNPNAGVVQADLRQPYAVLESAVVEDLIDFTRPVGVIFGSVMHFVEDGDDPWGIVASYRNALAPGSYLAVSHISDSAVHPRALEPVRALVARYNEQVAEALVMRTTEQVSRFFEGTTLVGAVMPLPEWLPDAAPAHVDPNDLAHGVLIGGVGRVR